MEASERKKKMMDMTMKIIAERGLDSFSVAQAATAAAINEALVYRDFGTKENLLAVCYAQVNQEILQEYQNEEKKIMLTKEDMAEKMNDHWSRFFDCLIDGGYKTLFFQQYRDSAYHKKAMTEQKDVKKVIYHILSLYTKNTEDADYLCAYLLDGSVLFAKRIICGEISNTKETADKVWDLLNHGMRGLSEGR
jgi:AcrR family transcriptional regulator